MKALRIDVHGDLTEVDLPGDHGSRFVVAVRELVAAEGIQVLGLTNHWDAWLDEDGITTGRPISPFATALANHYGLSVTLRGTVVVTGADREASTAAPLSPEQIATIRQVSGAQPRTVDNG